MQLAELRWPQVRALSPDIPVVIPVAAIEQHGHHMPLFTDSLLLAEILRRAHSRLENSILVAPLTWLGNSDHHLDFPGTLSASPRVYLDLLGGLIENFLAHGFRRIVLLNGHGGNDVPGRQAIFEVRQRHRTRNDFLLIFATYWQLEARPWESCPDLEQRQMGHACEWETSMMLRLAPQLVHDHQSCGSVSFGNAFEPAARAWTTPDRSKTGHIGIPSIATAQKGELLFAAFSDAMVAFLQRVIDWDGHSWEG